MVPGKIFDALQVCCVTLPLGTPSLRLRVGAERVLLRKGAREHERREDQGFHQNILHRDRRPAAS